MERPFGPLWRALCDGNESKAVSAISDLINELAPPQRGDLGWRAATMCCFTYAACSRMYEASVRMFDVITKAAAPDIFIEAWRLMYKLNDTKLLDWAGQCNASLSFWNKSPQDFSQNILTAAMCGPVSLLAYALRTAPTGCEPPSHDGLLEAAARGGSTAHFDAVLAYLSAQSGETPAAILAASKLPLIGAAEGGNFALLSRLWALADTPTKHAGGVLSVLARSADPRYTDTVCTAVKSVFARLSPTTVRAALFNPHRPEDSLLVRAAKACNAPLVELCLSALEPFYAPAAGSSAANALAAVHPAGVTLSLLAHSFDGTPGWSPEEYRIVELLFNAVLACAGLPAVQQHGCDSTAAAAAGAAEICPPLPAMTATVKTTAAAATTAVVLAKAATAFVDEEQAAGGSGSGCEVQSSVYSRAYHAMPWLGKLAREASLQHMEAYRPALEELFYCVSLAAGSSAMRRGAKYWDRIAEGLSAQRQLWWRLLHRYYGLQHCRSKQLRTRFNWRGDGDGVTHVVGDDGDAKEEEEGEEETKRFISARRRRAHLLSLTDAAEVGHFNLALLKLGDPRHGAKDPTFGDLFTPQLPQEMPRSLQRLVEAHSDTSGGGGPCPLCCGSDGRLCEPAAGGCLALRCRDDHHDARFLRARFAALLNELGGDRDAARVEVFGEGLDRYRCLWAFLRFRHDHPCAVAVLLDTHDDWAGQENTDAIMAYRFAEPCIAEGHRGRSDVEGGRYVAVLRLLDARTRGGAPPQARALDARNAVDRPCVPLLRYAADTFPGGLPGLMRYWDDSGYSPFTTGMGRAVSQHDKPFLRDAFVAVHRMLLATLFAPPTPTTGPARAFTNADQARILNTGDRPFVAGLSGEAIGAWSPGPVPTALAHSGVKFNEVVDFVELFLRAGAGYSLPTPIAAPHARANLLSVSWTEWKRRMHGPRNALDHGTVLHGVIFYAGHPATNGDDVAGALRRFVVAVRDSEDARAAYHRTLEEMSHLRRR